MSPLLSLEGVTTGYGSSQVLFDMNLELAAGQVASLLGRNGMGKTTTLRAILGLLPIWSGEIRFLGECINQYPTEQIAQMGIALVPEGRQIFPNLTVAENLIAFRANRCGSPDPWTLERIYALFPRLEERATNMGNQLSGGEQQMLAIGRALLTNPHLLILDEATEGVSPLIRNEIWSVLSKIKSSGQSILVIDKYLDELIKVTDHHTFIEKGTSVHSCQSDALASNPDLWHRYMGL